MKRDWELMGRIFTAIENDNLHELIEQENEPTGEEQKDDFAKSGQLTRYILLVRHLEMLIDAGYIKGVDIRTSVDGFISFGLNNPRITLQGYDYADIVKDRTLLHQTINAIGKAGMMVSWETLKQFAPVLIKKAAMKYANKIMKEE